MKSTNLLIAASAIAYSLALSTPAAAQQTELGVNADARSIGTVAIGDNTLVSNPYSTAVGYYAYANGAQSVVLGSGASDMGFHNSVALGAGTRATSADQVNVGNRTISGLRVGIISSGSTDAVTGDQINTILVNQRALDDWQTAQINSLLGSSAKTVQAAAPVVTPSSVAVNTTAAPAEATGANSVAVGGGSSASGENSVAIGDNADAQALSSVAVGANTLVSNAYSTAVGYYAYANGAQSTVVGSGASDMGYNNSVALGAGTKATAADQVNVGNRTVSGLMAGAIDANSTDAVTGAQLFASNTRIGALETGLGEMGGRVDALEALALGTNADLRALDKRLNSKIDGSTAVAIAMSGNAFLPGKKINVTGNVGTYEGAWAGSMQVGAVVSPNAAINAAVAKNFNKRGGVGARAGFSLGW